MHHPIPPAVRPARAWLPARAVCSLSVVALLAVGCGAADNSLGRSFGQGGNSTEELRVSSRPPLSLPPEFTLRPERPGVARPVSAASPSSPARPAGRMSMGQEALLEASGPSADPDIRTKVNEDARLEAPNEAFTDQLMTWQRPPGQAPIIQRGSSAGLLGRLF